jgi:hypothetical protein
MHWHVHAYSGGIAHYRPIPRALPLRWFAFSRSHREFGTRTSRKNYGIVLHTTERLIPPLRSASYDHWIGCSKPGRWIQIIQNGAGLGLPETGARERVGGVRRIIKKHCEKGSGKLCVLVLHIGGFSERNFTLAFCTSSASTLVPLQRFNSSRSPKVKC